MCYQVGQSANCVLIALIRPVAGIYITNGQSWSMNCSGYFMGILFYDALSERRRKTETENRRMGESTRWEGI